MRQAMLFVVFETEIGQIQQPGMNENANLASEYGKNLKIILSHPISHKIEARTFLHFPFEP
jgi:hypothetical protein